VKKNYHTPLIGPLYIIHQIKVSIPDRYSYSLLLLLIITWAEFNLTSILNIYKGSHKKVSILESQAYYDSKGTASKMQAILSLLR